MYKRILVTTDGSALSKKAVVAAVKLAGLSKAELVAMRVVHRYAHSYFDGGMNGNAAEIAKIEAHWAADAQKSVDQVKMLGESKGLKVKSLVVKAATVADAVIATARKNNVDLIVMASHGRRGVKRLLLGSETQHVLTHSEVPVLVLR